jgi:hypothetical protein
MQDTLESHLSMLRPMDLGEILDQTFKLYRRCWKPLALLGLIIAVPSIIMQGIVQLSIVGLPGNALSKSPLSYAITAATKGDYSTVAQFLTIYLLFLLALGLLGPWVRGAIVTICSRTVLNQPVSIGESLRISGRRYWAFLGTALLSWVFFILAIPALIIAGLLFLAFLTLPIGLTLLTAFWIFTTHVIVLENVGGGMPALKRSYALFKTRFWPLLGLGLIFGLLAGVIALLIQYPASLLHTAVFKSTASAWFVALVTGITPMITAPFVTVGLTLAYYDTRVRKEGFDLEMLANAQLTNMERP